MCGSSLAARQPVLPACAENEGFPNPSTLFSLEYSSVESQKKQRVKDQKQKQKGASDSRGRVLLLE